MTALRDTLCNQSELKLLKIHGWISKGYSFYEVIILYNAEFGTEYFKELFSKKEGGVKVTC
jgi:hypothetical protein